MRCPEILTFECGKVIGQYSNELHHVVKFKCDPGSKLVGEDSIRCVCKPGEPPNWNPAPPRCEKIRTYTVFVGLRIRVV